MKKLLFSLICFMTIVAGVNARTYNYTFSGDDESLIGNGKNVVWGSISLNANGQKVEKNIDWTISMNDASVMWDYSNNRGIAFGDKKTACESLSLSTLAFNNISPDITIKKVTVYTCTGREDCEIGLTIKVGNSTSETYSITSNLDNKHVFDCSEKGKIELLWNAVQKKSNIFYIKGIEIEYVLPASMIEILDPVFTMPADFVYADEIIIYANGDSSKTSACQLYYTIDGTKPSYEDYNSDPRVGTTKNSKGWQMNDTLKYSNGLATTITVQAIEVEYDSVYYGNVIEETFYVSPTTPFMPVTEIADGGRYALVANDSVADVITPSKESGLFNGRQANVYEKFIETIDYNALKFTVEGNGYTIQDATGRYMYAVENSEELHFAVEKPANGAIWDISINAEGKAEIKNGERTIYHTCDINDINIGTLEFNRVEEGSNIYTIQDIATKRYLYVIENSNKVAFAETMPAVGALWEANKDKKGKIINYKSGDKLLYYIGVGKDENGKDKYVVRDIIKNEFGCYSAQEENMYLPEFYAPTEYPEATITPTPNVGNNRSEVKGLQEIIITCDKGISYSEDFTLKAWSDLNENKQHEVNSLYVCERVDENTLKFTIDTPLQTINNIDIYIVITGNIYLDPNGMKYPLTIENKNYNSICGYKHLGYAEPAVLENVSPANNETVEQLSHFIFTFSKEHVSHIDLKADPNQEQPKLYVEGTDKTYDIVQTTENGKLNKEQKYEMIAFNQLALKTTEPLLGNGTYILEIPAGYFKDRNDNKLDGCILKYIVKNDSGLLAGIEDVEADSDNRWTVYSIAGIKLLETTDVKELKNLAKGIYIINGKKVLVK